MQTDVLVRIESQDTLPQYKKYIDRFTPPLKAPILGTNVANVAEC